MEDKKHYAFDLLDEIKKNTLETIVEKFGGGGGSLLKDSKLSIMDVRDILYDECNKISHRLVDNVWRVKNE